MSVQWECSKQAQPPFEQARAVGAVSRSVRASDRTARRGAGKAQARRIETVVIEPVEEAGLFTKV